MAETACADDVAKSSAVYCVFPNKALCATQTKSSNVLRIQPFYAEVLEKWYVGGYWDK
jgi:hypothetical protein